MNGQPDCRRCELPYSVALIALLICVLLLTAVTFLDQHIQRDFDRRLHLLEDRR